MKYKILYNLIKTFPDGKKINFIDCILKLESLDGTENNRYYIVRAYGYAVKLDVWNVENMGAMYEEVN